MNKILETVFAAIFGAVIITLISILAALPVMWLWNGLMPAIFGLTKITFLQAFGLLILCQMLFTRTSSSSNSKD